MQPKKGKEATEVGKYLTVWHKQTDGSWKIFRDMNNADGPARGAAATDATVRFKWAQPSRCRGAS